MHPANELRGTISNQLQNKRILLALTGSIAAVNAVHLARDLICHGADVIPIMTPQATKIIHPDALEFATGHTPITKLTGQTEHVTYCGLVQDPIDLLLISPCTANTLSKIAHGIDDTPVTTFATTAIGSHIPIVLVPAMHLSMYQHPKIQQNLQQCKELNIHIISPNITENKAKMPTTLQINPEILRILGPSDLTHEKILIIGGSTAQYLDTVRILTTPSSGKTAIALATNAHQRNAHVTLWYGSSTNTPPPHLHTLKFQTFNELDNLIQKTDLSRYTTIIVCAAIADYTPQKYPGKIPSGQSNLTITLKPTPKLLKKIHKKTPKTKLIAFKLEPNAKQLQKKTGALQKTYNLHLSIGNTIQTLGSDTNTIILIDKNGYKNKHTGSKDHLANIILDTLKE
jgi:phosphopantothenoylcysteine decarboxylase/phosphopantothenate--cysteine ligase